MNNFIARVTSPGARKYLYRVAWAATLALVASGRLDAAQLEVVLGLIAAVLAVADSQTPTDSAVVDTADSAEASPEWLTAAGYDWVPPED